MPQVLYLALRLAFLAFLPFLCAFTLNMPTPIEPSTRIAFEQPFKITWNITSQDSGHLEMRAKSIASPWLVLGEQIPVTDKNLTAQLNISFSRGSNEVYVLEARDVTDPNHIFGGTPDNFVVYADIVITTDVAPSTKSPNTQETPGSTIPTNNSPESTSSSKPVGAIIGGVLGGIVFFGSLLYSVFAWRRGKRSAAAAAAASPTPIEQNTQIIIPTKRERVQQEIEEAQLRQRSLQFNMQSIRRMSLQALTAPDDYEDSMLRLRSEMEAMGGRIQELEEILQELEWDDATNADDTQRPPDYTSVA